MNDSQVPDRLVIKVTGRPAPQGSKHHGEHGQMRESSPYLAAWRAAVKRDTYRAYRELGVGPEELPLFMGPVGVAITFYLRPEQLPQARIDGPPDYDKLCRATWDALTQARVFEDDGRVVEVGAGRKVLADGLESGAVIEVWRVTP